ncbi:hypothetical protein TUM3794_19780 [Shewanella colwelliana]|uniref:Uncharacterized protein n=1 Tax=Shewanella colwelliana TaxID=23 RepID=A0ABQ4P080_SHECO|nr:hypothetical protein [Shewanella colwelliana]GIU40864.1 hypothetical protein TUM3794_19780 [Shewanella colwelliana]
MGFFSWNTSDTNESIANIHSGHPNATRTVYMLQPGGKEPIECRAYEGYGVFGGVDAFAWLAKFNSEQAKSLDLFEDCEELRKIGIDLFFKNRSSIIYPLKFSFHKNAKYEQLAAAKDCNFQGFFYDHNF